jgi:SAM-dependent methyltransferase
VKPADAGGARAADERALLHLGGRSANWGSLGLWPHETIDAAGTTEAAEAAQGAQSAQAAQATDTDYAGACTALALAVGRAAGLQPGWRVLSVACGAGEELRLWQRHFGAAAVCGVESDAALVTAAGADSGADGGPADGHTRVLQGSGCALQALGLQPGSFDAVVCVDAAYHLRPRIAFLEGAFTLLRPGGRLAYTDLLIDDEGPPEIDVAATSPPLTRAAWKSAVLRASARACGLSAEDLPGPRAQLQRLRALGFTGPSLQRLDLAVLDGFARHVRRQSQRHGLSAWQAAWRRPAITALLIAPCRAAGLGYALIAATRP